MKYDLEQQIQEKRLKTDAERKKIIIDVSPQPAPVETQNTVSAEPTNQVEVA